LAAPQIEPITEQVPDQVPLGKAQRLDGQAYESPALPLSYSAGVTKLIERDPERQPQSQYGTRAHNYGTAVVPAMTAIVVVVFGAVVAVRVCWRHRHRLATRWWAQA
jgi:hypothetical protein